MEENLEEDTESESYEEEKKRKFCCNTFKESGQECGKGDNGEKPQAIHEN